MLKENRKAQIGIGVLVLMAVAVIVGLVMFQQVATNVEQGTRSVTGAITIANSTKTFPAAGSKLILTGQELLPNTIVITNATGGGTVPSTNYTIAEEVRTTDGLKGIVVTGKAGDFAAASVNVSYQYYPDGYIDDGGARSITGLIVLLAAIAIALVVLGGIKWGDW